jgi:hypothetical protein
MDLFWVRKIFCEKAHERLYLALFAVHTGKKKISWKSVKIFEFTWKSVNLEALFTALFNDDLTLYFTFY